MANYKLTIEYDGKNFYGWQRQRSSSKTIQQQIELSLEKILKVEIKITGAGRTDAGVSAYNQIANFHFEKKLDLHKLKYSLNSILPPEITIRKVQKVQTDFHSRYSAIKRQYIYKISLDKISLRKDEYLKINYIPEFQKIDEFIKLILKQKKFYSFCRNREDRRDFMCDIMEFEYIYFKNKNEIIFKITANRFLHSMVRAIIGCALEISRNKISLNYIKEIIKKGEKIKVYYLPPKALFLNKIYY